MGVLSVSKVAEGELIPLGGKQGILFSKSCHLEGSWGLRFPHGREGKCTGHQRGLNVLMLVNWGGVPVFDPWLQDILGCLDGVRQRFGGKGG